MNVVVLPVVTTGVLIYLNVVQCKISTVFLSAVSVSVY